MKEIILLKSGEIILKGLNRGTFENILISNAKRALKGVGSFKIYKAQSTFYVEPKNDNADMDLAVEKLRRVFGIAGIARSCVVEKDFDIIKEVAVDYLSDELTDAKTFKVEAKRADKKFPMTSPEISSKLGAYILKDYPDLKVDVHNPELIVTVEVRDFAAYIHANQLPGAGGMPVGGSGKGALLISGGIDSPVAGYMMAKRGVEIVAVHFESPPYTSSRALQKVETLCEKMSEWTGPVKFYTVPFTKPQEDMKKVCPDQYITLIMRRLMMRISEIIAKNEGCGALITGESVGQVASQTLMSLASTDNVVETLPVLRPVVGMDKEEIVAIARKIDTYETSILPYEDCCTVFTPRRPKTNPTIPEVQQAESELDIEAIVSECVAGATYKIIG